MESGKRAFVRLLWAWAIGYPLVIVWGVDLAVGVVLKREVALAADWLPKLFQSAIAAMPFVALAVCGEVLIGRNDRRALSGLRFAAVSVAIASLTIWIAYYGDAIRAYIGQNTGQDSGGANIGLGLLLVFSPMLLSLLIPIAYLVGVRLSKF
ncbi:MAG: hypothetical protein WBA76_13680 [Phormidesmis sp.]